MVGLDKLSGLFQQKRLIYLLTLLQSHTSDSADCIYISVMYVKKDVWLCQTISLSSFINGK